MSSLTPRINKIERNSVINGNFDFWQRVGGNNTAFTTGNTGFTADRFKAFNVGPTAKTINIIRSANVPTVTQAGYQSQYSMQFQSGTVVSSLAATDYILPHTYSIEGLDYQGLHGKAVTISFWIYASVVGTYCFSMNNSNGSRAYVTTYTVNQANTWEQKFINVTLDTAGVWNFDNTVGLNLYFTALTGSTFQTSTFNQWQSANVFGATTATNYMATASATINIAQVMLVEGTATANSIFHRRAMSIGQEFIMCQRYYEANGHGTSDTGNASGVLGGFGLLKFVVEKRANPTMTLFNGANANQARNNNNGASEGSLAVGSISTNFAQIRSTSALNDNIDYTFSYTADAEL